MIALISVWKLKNGCPAELREALETLAARVEAQEEHTLSYNVHLGAPAPLNAGNSPANPPPPPIPGAEQTAVTFYERYAGAQAFADHLNGPCFTEFRQTCLPYFYEDPQNPGWPNTETTFLTLQSGFTRP